MQLGRSLRVCSLTHKFLDYLPSIELQAQLAQQRKDDTTGDTLLVVQVLQAPTTGAVQINVMLPKLAVS